MRSIILILLLGALVSLTLDDPERVAATLLRDARTFIGDLAPGRRDAATRPDGGAPRADVTERLRDGWSGVVGAASEAAVSIGLPRARQDDRSTGMAEPASGATAPVLREEPRRRTVALASPAQRDDIARTAPEPAPGTVEPIASHTAAPLVPMDLPEDESGEAGLPEILPVPSSSGAVADEQLQAAAADAIQLYRKARDILWNLN